MNINRKEYELAGGYELSRHIGQVVAGGVLQVLGNLKPETDTTLKAMQQVIHVPSNMPEPKDMAEAHMINDLHKAGKDKEIPFEGMELTTVVAEAGRMVRLENGPAEFPMTLTGVAIGNVAFAGVPGEPFNGVGLGIKKAEGWDLVLPCCLCNGSEGYFPMQDSYDEGGYEARSSRFKAGTAEIIVQQSVALLNELH